MSLSLPGAVNAATNFFEGNEQTIGTVLTGLKDIYSGASEPSYTVLSDEGDTQEDAPYNYSEPQQPSSDSGDGYFSEETMVMAKHVFHAAAGTAAAIVAYEVVIKRVIMGKKKRRRKKRRR